MSCSTQRHNWDGVACRFYPSQVVLDCGAHRAHDCHAKPTQRIVRAAGG